jgi:hypothetical protein
MQDYIITCYSDTEVSLLKQSVRLSLFFFFLLFLSGRIGLFLHEFVGHALSLHLIGEKITAFSLFMFGGGRVHYSYSPATDNLSIASLLLVDLSGISVELLAGGIVFMLAIFLKTNRSIKGLFIATASVLIVHSLFYLVICTYYGSGDGRILFNVLQGGIRQTFLFLIFSLNVAGAFLVSYVFSPIIRCWTLEGSSKKRALMIVLCAFAAALLHGALTVGEQIKVKDNIYAELKTSKNVRLKNEELSQFITQYTKKHGREPDPEHIAIVEKKLESKYWQFPIEIPLGIGVIAAFTAGFFWSRRKDSCKLNPVTWQDIALLSCFSVIVALLILTMNRF